MKKLIVFMFSIVLFGGSSKECDQWYNAIVFPNPTEDFLNIKAISFKNINYSLFNEMGKLVLSGTLYSKKTSLDVSKLHTGLYSLVLNSTENKLKTFNIIKTH